MQQNLLYKPETCTESSPALAEVPEDASEDERDARGEEVAHAVVLGRLPVGAAVLPEARRELHPEVARVLRIEPDRRRAFGGAALPGDQLLIAPGGRKGLGGLGKGLRWI